MIRNTFSFLLVLAAIATQAQATQIEVTVTTTGPVGLAPVLGAFHDGSYSIFNGGANASPGLELLAELGDASTALTEASAAGVMNAAAFAPGGPFAPNGGTGSQTFIIDASDTDFSLAAMLLPSNDWFIGTSGSVDVSSLYGAANGTSLSFDLSTVYDAGTEDEDFMYAPGGGLVGITTAATPPAGTETSSVITIVTGADPFGRFDNIPAGFDTTSIDFMGSPIANVQLTVVPEPASVSMLGLGLLGLMGLRRRRS